MEESEHHWTFLTCHGRVLVYLAKNPKATEREIAQDIGVTERAIQKVIHDLVTEGYVVCGKVGRCNRYVVHAELPMRHRLERQHAVGDILHALEDVRRAQKPPRVKRQ